MPFFKKKNKNTPVSDGSDRPASPSAGAALGRSFPGALYAAWPKKNGEPEPPAFLKRCATTNLEDELLIHMLSAYGIPAVRLYPADGSFGKLVLGISAGGADLYVPESMLDEAISLIGGLTND